MTIAKLALMLVCLMSVTLAKDAKVTPLLSKDLTDFPGKEGLMITVEYPPGGSVRAALPTVFWVLIGASARRMIPKQTSAQS